MLLRKTNDKRAMIRYNGGAEQKHIESEERDMAKFILPDKRSKKARREFYAERRRTWGDLNPVTRSVPSGKTYNRKKEKQRIGKEFRDGFGADLFICKSV